jgi:hypothetical protein
MPGAAVKVSLAHKLADSNNEVARSQGCLNRRTTIRMTTSSEERDGMPSKHMETKKPKQIEAISADLDSRNSKLQSKGFLYIVGRSYEQTVQVAVAMGCSQIKVALMDLVTSKGSNLLLQQVHKAPLRVDGSMN